MRDSSRIILLIVIMAVIAGLSAGMTIILLYEAAVNEQRSRLVETAQSQARLIESIARFNSINLTDYPGGPFEATLFQVKDAHKNYTGFGKTGEFTLSKRIKDEIVFLLGHRHNDLPTPEPVPWDSALAEPMRQALAGNSGTMIGLDYRGEKVLAAFEPLNELSLGIVAKIDLAEIRAPFKKAGLISGLSALLVVIAGAFLFARVTQPMIEELKDHRAHLEVLVEERTAELHRSNRDLEDLAHIISHDLREPLRGINNFSMLLLEDYSDTLPGEGRYMLETLTTLSKRQEEQIISILNYSRAGRSAVSIVTVDLNEVVKEVLESLKISLTENQVEVRFAARLPFLNLDREHLTIIYNNLISNGLKYNDKAYKWLEIGSRPSPEGNGELFYVSDNGIGIADKHQDKVFTIFKRLHHRDQFGGGTGAGLAIVKKIVERHRGKIWLHSELGKGTTFFFEFPA